jgi:hypothetical protein
MKPKKHEMKYPPGIRAFAGSVESRHQGAAKRVFFFFPCIFCF